MADAFRVNQVLSFQKSASWMRNVLSLLDGQILMTRRRSWASILPKMQQFFRAKARLSAISTFDSLLKIDQTQSIGMLDFLSVTLRTQTHFLSLYFVPRQKLCKATKTKMGIDIIFDQGSPQIRSDIRLTMSEHANVMSKTASMHSFWRFCRECNASLQVLEGDNRALARKNHVQARCKFSSRTPSSKSPHRAKSKDFASKRLSFGKSGPD